MTEGEAAPDARANAMAAAAADPASSAPDSMATVPRHTWWERSSGTLAEGLSLLVQWLFLLTVLALPLDAYLTLPAQNGGIFLSQVLTLEAAGLLLLALAAGWLAWHETGLRFHWRDMLPLGFVLLAGLVSLFGASSFSIAIKECLKVAVLLALYVLARTLRGTPNIRFRTLAALLGGFVVVVVLGLLQTRSGITDIAGILLNIQRSTAELPVSGILRAEATFRYPNELAAYLLLMLPLLATAVARIPWLFERSAVGVLLVLGIWLLLLTYTRGALIAALVVTPVLLYFVGGRLLAILGSVAAAALVAVALLRGSTPSSRLLSLLTPSDPGYSTRLAAWRWAVSSYLHHPLTGVGLGNLSLQPGAPYIDAVNQVREIDAENLILNVLAEMGLLGVAAVVYCLVGALRRAWAGLQEGLWRETDDWVDQIWNIGTFVALCAILVYGIGDPVLVSGQVTGLLCVLVGLAGSRTTQRAPGPGDTLTLAPVPTSGLTATTTTD